MAQHDQPADGKTAQPGAKGDYAQYLSKYAKGGSYQKYMGDYQQYVPTWSKGIKKFTQGQQPQGKTIYSAQEAKNETELRAWREAQTEQIENFVPEAFQKSGLKLVRQQYETRLAELRNTSSAVDQAAASTQAAGAQVAAGAPMMFSAAQCKTVKELKAWRDAQIARIKDSVPKPFQHFPLDSVEKEFKKQLAALEKKLGQNATHANATHPNATHATPKAEAASAALEAPAVLVQDPSGADAADAQQQFVKKYAGPHQAFIPPQAKEDQGGAAQCGKLTQHAKLDDATTLEVPMVLATAQMAENESELRTMHACQVAEIKASVPAAYQRYALHDMDAQFKERLAQLKDPKAAAPTPQRPVLLVAAARCESEAELRAWFAHQMKEVDASVPEPQREMARHTLADAFRERLANLSKDFGHSPSLDSITLAASTASAAPADSARAAPGHLGWALVFVLGGLATPAFLAAVGRRQSRPEGAEGYLLATEDMDAV